jgi:Carboxypeptidase regulatory-like domain
MKRICVCSIFLLILSGFYSNCLLAQDQSSVRGQLSGVVVDPTGAVIQGASISIMGPTGGAQRASNDQGEFTFPALIPGFYDVKVTKDGFKGTTVQKVEVGINKTSTIRVALELGAVTQTVEVVASAVSVESQSTAVTADITDTVYNNLPLGRSITNVFYVSPGVASGIGSGSMNPAISGGSGLENAYIADGVLLNDAAFGALGVYQRTYGGIGVGINASFVKEVQVNTAAFGPQYGHTTGGVINMVTKSGGNAFHGVVGGYFQSAGMSATYANNQDFNPVNKLGTFVAPRAYEGDFELGGYVPLGFLKNHLFFFGAFNPTWNDNLVAPAIGSGLFTATNGLVHRKDTIWDYSGKVTVQLNQNHQVEASVFGDPTHSNLAPWSTLNIDNTSANSAQTFGSRNLAVRYNGTFGSSLVLAGAFTMNWNRFDENPLSIPEIADVTQTAVGQRGQFRAQGFGALETYDSVSKGIQFDVHKSLTILGQQHTFSAGYIWNFPTYNDNLGYSGGKIPIQTTNVDGQPIFTGTGATAVTGQSQEFALQLRLASSVAAGAAPGSTTCTLCPYMNINGVPQQVVLQESRGQFSGFTSVNTSKYHAGYVNDDWEISKYATLSVGVRWEQQRMSTGGGVTQLLNDQWNPRIGFSVDPKGDRKSKIYANFGRYAWVMPLDAAIRELNVENEVENIYFAPVTSNCANGTCGPASPSNLATLNQFGTVTFDPKNVLNNAAGGIVKDPTVLLISGSGLSTPFAPQTKMEYNDEFVVGAEHEFRGGITASVRYIDRRVKRIIEDFTGISIEQSLSGQAGAYFIGNPTKATDVTVNPNPLVFSQGASFTPTGIPCTAVGKPTGCNPGISYPTGYAAGCYDSNGVLTPYTATNLQTSLQAANSSGFLGSVCYPSVNDPTTWSVANPDCGHVTVPPQPACGTPGNPAFVVDPNALFGGEAQSDGISDGLPPATRNYQAIEIEVNKSLSHNWSLISNWRIARLRGNFEGAFRNDNGQNDPGISSLYDFTPGVLGEIGFQLAPGPLNADRLHIVNVYPTYTFDKTFLKGLIVTPGVRIESGLPLTTLVAQEPYVNTGEVPINGRGDLGRGPVTGTVDVHLDYPWRISESKSLHLSVDLMNIANTRRNLLVDQFADVTFGLKSADYTKPGYYPYPFNAAGQNLVTGFVQPFSARFHVSFNF